MVNWSLTRFNNCCCHFWFFILGIIFIQWCQGMFIYVFIGSRCLSTYPRTTLPPTMLQDSLNHGEGRPSPMLSVRDLPTSKVEKFIEQTNAHLPKEKHIAISLVNGARNLVLSGPPESLYGFNLNLRNVKAPNGLDQSRIPFSERKLKCSNRFCQFSLRSILIF